MLQKFLFIGVGGSGGVTLRALRTRLAELLVEEGYDGGIPDAWQFLHVDVPLVQDRKPERLPLLPEDSYAGLAISGLSYGEIDRMSTRAEPVIRHTTGWRPKPDDVSVAPESGGGRFRAVGRVILGARMDKVDRKLTAAIGAMQGEHANDEFARVCRKLTGDGQPTELPTQVVVISSLAGGSGSGLFIDLCDLIRQHIPGFRDRGVAILYTPEVFTELSTADRAGVNPNALAAVCELLNSQWNREGPAPDELAFMESAGAVVNADVRGRGPRISYMIGRSNGQVEFADHAEVYEAVARGLSVWCTSATIQDSFDGAEIGNWAARAQQGVDRTGLTSAAAERPLSSYGCASVGIGLERFARYSIDRLANEAMGHLLSGHWRAAQEKEITEEQARLQQVEDSTPAFVAACGLGREAVLAAIRGGSADEARDRLRARIKAGLLDRVTEAWPRQAAADRMAQRVIDRMKERWAPDYETCQKEYVSNTVEWVNELPKTLRRQAAALVAERGGRVAVGVLEEARGLLTATVVDDLKTARSGHERAVGDLSNRVVAALAGAATGMQPSHPKVGAATDAAIDGFHARTEQLAHDLAIDLAKDIAGNLLQPLRDAINGAVEHLHVDRVGTSSEPSPVPGWPGEDNIVPNSYYPARNELVLEPVRSYPTQFTTLLQEQASASVYGDALKTACRVVITGTGQQGSADQLLIKPVTSWIPRVPMLGFGSPTTARFEVHARLTDLRARARDCIWRQDTPMARHLGQTLGSYLNGAGRSPQIQQTRIDEFGTLLAQAVKLSRPLIGIDPTKMMDVHAREINYREVMTPLPFAPGHPGFDAARGVFEHLKDGEFARLLGDDTERIDIFTYLDEPVQPSVMASLTDPISRQWHRERLLPDMAGFWKWRRARQLPWFVPCAPPIRRDVVAGWFVARFLDQIRCAAKDRRSAPTEVWLPDGGYVAFPSPLLGGKLHHTDEWLPAVLETMALTVLGESFEPYQRLAELGASLEQLEELGSRGELGMWLLDGETEPGAPVPNPALAGTPTDDPMRRAKAAQEYLAKLLEHYRAYERKVRRAQDGLDVSRAWEIRDDIVAGLGRFRDAVEKISTTDLAEPDDLG